MLYISSVVGAWVVCEYMSYARFRKRLGQSLAPHSPPRGGVACLSAFLLERDIDPTQFYAANRKTVGILGGVEPTDAEITRAFEHTREFPGLQLWRQTVWYRWLVFKLLYRFLRTLGSVYLFLSGYRRSSYATTDGTYVIWSRYVPGSRPVVVFPGMGLGASPYIRVIRAIYGNDRTVHMVEVPNLGGVAWTSPTGGTLDHLCKIVRPYVVDADIFAHCIGTLHCACVINESDGCKRTVTLIDPLCLPVPNLLDFISIVYLSIDRHYSRWKLLHPRATWIEWVAFHVLISRSLEVASTFHHGLSDLTRMILKHPDTYLNTRFHVVAGDDDHLVIVDSICEYTARYPAAYNLIRHDGIHGQMCIPVIGTTLLDRIRVALET